MNFIMKNLYSDRKDNNLKTLRSILGRLGIYITHAIIYLILLGCMASNAQAASDIYISGIVLYTKLPDGSPEAKEYGTYPKIKSYDPHAGLAPEKVDVVVIVNGKNSEEVTTVLEIFPVAGITNWEQTEGITELQLLDNSKVTLSGELRLEKKVLISGRTEIKFSNIDISKIIKSLVQRDFWPAELIFKAVTEPIKGETSLLNNIMEFRLQMKPAD